MANPSNALVLRFRTDLGDAQRNLGNFASTAASNLASLGARAIETKKAIDFLGANAKAIKLGVASFVGIEALLASIHLVDAAAQAAMANLQHLVDIGSGASRAGVGTSFFQAWTQQAEKLNLKTGDLVAMLEKAREAMTETIGENGGASKSLGADRIRQNVLAGNLGAADQSAYDAAASQEARFRVVLDLIERLRQKGAQLAAFDLGKTFFGATFEAQLRNGVDMIGAMRRQLDGVKSSGGERIIPQAEIENAERMKAELEAINDRIANQMKPVLEQISAIEQGSLEILIDVKRAFVDIVDVATDVSRVLSSWTIEPFMKGLELDVQAFLNVLRPVTDIIYGRGFLDNYARSKTQAPVKIGNHLEFDSEGNPTLVQDQQLAAITVHADKSKPLPSLTPEKAKKPAEAADQVETYITSLKKQTAAEEAEAQTLGLSNKAKTEAIDLAKAQIAAEERKKPLTAAETDQVRKLADAYVSAKQKIEDYARAQESAKATAQFFGQSLEGAIEKLIEPGAKLQDVLRGVVQALEQAALKALILGEGPLANLFGTGAPSGATGTAGIGGLFGAAVNGLGALFSGAHADGGTIPLGKFGLVGEAGPEFINGPATVTPMKQINAALDAGRARGGSHTVNMAIDVTGARGNSEIEAMVASGVQAGMSQVHQKIARDIGPIMQRWQMRNG